MVDAAGTIIKGGTMRLCILEAGAAPEELAASHGSYARQIARWLARGLPDASYTDVSVVGGERVPDPLDFDGFVVSGSEYGVYDDLPWMRALKHFLNGARAAERPVFGICFGHQIMADAFGGRVEKSEFGWSVGVGNFRLPDADHAQPVYLYHQDQVVDLPPSANIVGSGPYAPAGVLAYEFPAASVQFHPEYTLDIFNHMLDICGHTLPDDVLRAARRSLARPVEPNVFLNWVSDFFRQSGRAARIGRQARS